MEMALKSQTRELTLEQLKNKLTELEKKYFDSIGSNLEGDAEILKELEFYKKQRRQLLAEKSKVKGKANVSTNKVVSETVELESKNCDITQDKRKTKQEQKKTECTLNQISKVNNKVIVMDSVKFNFSKGTWSFCFYENGDKKREEYSYKHSEFHESNRIKKEKRKRYGNKNLKQIDIGLYTLLHTFDTKYQTEYSKKYLRSDISYDIKYNFSDFFTNSYYSLKDKFSLLMNANRQKKYKNAMVDNSKLVSATPAIIVATLVLGILGISGKKEVKTYPESSQYKSEQTMTNVTTSSNTNTNLALKSDKVITQEENKQETSTVISEKQEEKSQKQYLQDNYNLEQLSLSDKVVNSDAFANTSKLNCNYYNISLISVVSNNEILEIEDADFLENKLLTDVISDYKTKYGEEIDLYVNFDGYDKDGNMMYQSIGWANIDKLNNSKKTSNQAKLEQLYKIRKELTANTNSVENKGYQKRKTI